MSLSASASDKKKKNIFLAEIWISFANCFLLFVCVKMFILIPSNTLNDIFRELMFMSINEFNWFHLLGWHLQSVGHLCDVGFSKEHPLRTSKAAEGRVRRNVGFTYASNHTDVWDIITAITMKHGSLYYLAKIEEQRRVFQTLVAKRLSNREFHPTAILISHRIFCVTPTSTRAVQKVPWKVQWPLYLFSDNDEIWVSVIQVVSNLLTKWFKYFW